jgi:hypothetical protein
MNRTVIIVKTPHKKREYAAIRLHWNYGQAVEDWIRTEYGSWERAYYDLISLGHRSTIEKAHREPGNLPEHQTFSRLRDAKAWCEHITLAYHDGKLWRFEHVDT